MKDYRILAITEEGYDAGFRLAGVDAEIVKDNNGMLAIIEKCFEDKNYGIIIVDAEIFYKIEERKRKVLEESVMPVIIPLYLKQKGKVSAEEYLKEVVRRAIGYSIRIKG